MHSEGDLLPGLIVDRYGEWLVVQLLDQGMDRLTNEIVEALSALLNRKASLRGTMFPREPKKAWIRRFGYSRASLNPCGFR